jgi:hypothetical protein
MEKEERLGAALSRRDHTPSPLVLAIDDHAQSLLRMTSSRGEKKKKEKNQLGTEAVLEMSSRQRS